MHPVHAQLSSMSTTLDDLVERVTEAGEQLLADDRESDAADLFEVERSLRAAAARLSGAISRLG